METVTTNSLAKTSHGLLFRTAQSLLGNGRWEVVLLVALIILAPLLAFYNLGTNPRPWHDEGSYLSLAKTLVQDGVYAVRSSEGYQTFGAVQSVGPTVLLPIALSFKLWGVGLLQGRMVAAIFLLLTLGIFYAAGHALFGRRPALFAVILLLASPAVGFLLYGRPAFGEIPALGFLLAGWFVWARGVRGSRPWHYPLAGLLIGAAMVTKSQYTIVGFAALALLALVDLVYYRQRVFKSLIVVGAVAFLCVAAWWLWQMLYFGMASFQENAAKLRLLASQTTGFHLHTTIEAIKTLVGSGTGYFYFFWGILALIYGVFLCIPREKDSAIRAFLLVFAGVWLAYYTFWIVPWSRYLLPAAAITALFVGKLASDLLEGLWASRHELWDELRQASPARAVLSAKALVTLGTLVALLSLACLTGYHLQRIVRSDVLDKTGNEAVLVVSPPQFETPNRVADLLNEKIDRSAVIETWERELGVLTDHRYHFPDQSLLAQTDSFIYHGGDRNYALGAKYFDQVRPAYVIEGWYARFNQIYDIDYLQKHGNLVATVGDGVWRYDIYKLQTQ